MLSNTKIATNQAKSHIAEFEGLRGILCWWVVFSHILLFFGITDEDLGSFKFILNASQAVNVFIIMSGFFIFSLLNSGRENYKQFITRRFLRIFPAYFVCLVFSILLTDISVQALQNLPWKAEKNLIRLQIFQDSLDYFWQHLIAHITMLHGVIPDSMLPSSSFTFIGQAWSISLEWQFYLVAPFLFYIVSKKNTWGIYLILFSALLYLFAKVGSAFLFTQIPFFLVGIISFYIWKSPLSLPKKQKGLILVCSVILVTVFTGKPDLIVWTIVFLSALINRNSQENGIFSLVSKILNNKIILYFGRISYSIYLIHMVVIYSLLYLMTQYFYNIDKGWYLLSIFVVSLPLITIAAHYLYNWIEKPFITLGKRIAANF
ncbi:acyltransferase family protein [Nostoc cycadae]|uniref:Acyltransferase n=1 Tax=Nostoc cycadae WK-1 TaxID=1861711 RepID=A0A2H6LFK6_9NOSO|nr:acyltransferase [Nostoc cycadae]GBE92002.1 acyltransferase [Nostoc cycadae WK-1]